MILSCLENVWRVFVDKGVGTRNSVIGSVDIWRFGNYEGSASGKSWQGLLGINVRGRVWSVSFYSTLILINRVHYPIPLTKVTEVLGSDITKLKSVLAKQVAKMTKVCID